MAVSMWGLLPLRQFAAFYSLLRPQRCASSSAYTATEAIVDNPMLASLNYAMRFRCVVLAGMVYLSGALYGHAKASSEDDCIEAQERLKAAKDDAADAARQYARCAEEHDNSDDCSSEKSALDSSHDEVEEASDAATNECSVSGLFQKVTLASRVTLHIEHVVL
jgi:hypothetical protein